MGSETANQAALEQFDEGRKAFRAEMERVPEAALDYLKPGDDYALGGLVFHVNAVLERYIDVIQGVMAGPEEVVLADPAPMFARAHAKARAGARPEELRSALETMDNLHRQFRSMAASVAPGDWERQSSVQEGTNAPYQASAADVVGWVSGHYQEHIPQVRELVGDWQSRA